MHAHIRSYLYFLKHSGVYYDVVTNCWIALYRSNNFPVCKSFSAEYHGFEMAKQMAIDRVNKYKR